MSPFFNKTCPVTLGTRTPHSRSFGAVKHSELYGCSIGYFARLSSKSVYFAYYLAFGYTAYSRVATHLSYFVHVYRYQTCFSSCPCRCRRRFATGMSGSYDYNVKVKFSIHVLDFINYSDANLRYSLYSFAFFIIVFCPEVVRQKECGFRAK